MQILLVSVLLGNLGVGVPDFGMLPTLAILVGITTVLSGFAYLGQWVFGVRVNPDWRPERPRASVQPRGRYEGGR